MHRTFPAETLGETSCRPASVSLLETEMKREFESCDSNRPASVDLSTPQATSYSLNNNLSNSATLPQNRTFLRDPLGGELSASATLPDKHSHEFGTTILGGKRDSGFAIATSGAGSSLSVDSGNPHGASDVSYGTRSMESLDEVRSTGASASASLENIPASQQR